MDQNTTRAQESKNPSPINSPNSNGSSSNNNGVQIHTPPVTPKPMIPTTTRSDTNPYPTTFVQADTTTFKQVVQMLTGSTETAKQASNSKPPPSDPQQPQPQHQQQTKNYIIPPIKTTTPKKQNFKLYERRNNNLKNSLMINTLVPCYGNKSTSEILSPSLLDFPKLALSSPVTPLNEYSFNKSSMGNSSSSSSEEEERAIAEKGFYLHPSPMSTPRESQPQLLSLFPVTSPRVSGSS